MLSWTPTLRCCRSGKASSVNHASSLCIQRRRKDLSATFDYEHDWATASIPTHSSSLSGAATSTTDAWFNGLLARYEVWACTRPMGGALPHCMGSATILQLSD